MTDDMTTFLLAFGAVWLGLGAYFVYLHKLERDLARAIARLEKDA